MILLGKVNAMMSWKFNETIENWKDWGRVFQSIPAFQAIAHDMLKEAGVGGLPLENLTPGTNGVFRAGPYVLKIFVPVESGFDSFRDYENEKSLMAHMEKLGIPAPHLLHTGTIQDKYLFRYILMDYIQGEEAGEKIRTYDENTVSQFTEKLKDIMSRLNRPAPGLVEPVDIIGRVWGKDEEGTPVNDRWQGLHPGLQDEMEASAREQDLSSENLVLVHGDLTGENVLIRPDTSLVLIDFADALLAPSWYELGSLFFELFRMEPRFIRPFAAGRDKEELTEHLVQALAIHDFGGDLLKTFLRDRGIPLNSVTSLTHLKKLIHSVF